MSVGILNPRWPTLSPAMMVPISKASRGFFPFIMAAINAAVKVSPAPTVSTTFVGTLAVDLNVSPIKKTVFT